MSVKFNGISSENTCVRKGVRQGCLLSPDLFNTVGEIFIKKTFNKFKQGIKIGIKRVHIIKFSDVPVLLTDSFKTLAIMIYKLNATIEKHGMKINIKKTKVMIIGKTDQ